MADKDLIERRIARLTKELESERDNSTAAKHVRIAGLHRYLGQPQLAADWYLKAAAHSIWSELGAGAVIFAQLAVHEDPTNPAIRQAYAEIWEKWGSPGPAPDPMQAPPTLAEIRLICRLKRGL